MDRQLQRFPDQVSGYCPARSALYYVVLTPVYVQAGRGQALLNVLLAGFEINDKFAYALKESTHGSDFVFVSGDRLIASSILSLSVPNFCIPHAASRADLRKLSFKRYRLPYVEHAGWKISMDADGRVDTLSGPLPVRAMFSMELQRNVG